MTTSIHWHQGDPDLCYAIEAALPAALEKDDPVHEGPHRKLVRLSLDSPSRREVVVKLYRPTSRLRRLRASLRRRVDLGSAAREWASLAAAQRAGLGVPTPRARGQRSDGAELLVMEYQHGQDLALALAAASGSDRTALLVRLAEAVHAFHRAGFAHGDLHAGNIRVSEGRIILLDLAKMREIERDADPLGDWARLSFSLDRNAALAGADRELRELAALGTDFDRARQHLLADHQHGRVRRHLRAGGAWKAISARGGWRGLATRDVDGDELLSLLGSLSTKDPDDTRRDGRVRIFERTLQGRPVVLKEVRAGGIGRALADRFRGSAGARGFRLGQADALVSDRAAYALAFVDRRTLGIPRSSWLVMDRVGESDLDSFAPESSKQASRIAWHLAAWIAEQHAQGLFHRDLKGGNLRIRLGEGSPTFWLIDLTDLHGPAPLSEADRTTALVQLNASLDEDRFDRESRLTALEAYTDRLPFETPLEVLASEIARASLARRHRFTGRDCDCLLEDNPPND